MASSLVFTVPVATLLTVMWVGESKSASLTVGMAVMGIGDGDATQQAAEQLARTLERRGGLTITTVVTTPTEPTSDGTDESWRERLARARALVQQGRDSYVSLDPPAALQATNDAASLARTETHRSEAAAVLAEALRVRGLTHLYLGQLDKAVDDFASAGFLAPDFAPSTTDWPPQARLAYADAQARARDSGSSPVSVRVEPAWSAVWLDGRLAAVGSTTLRNVPAGVHVLFASAPGFHPVAATVTIHGGGKLEEASLFLEPEGETARLYSARDAMAEALGGKHESRVARQVAASLGVEWLVVVTTGVASSASKPRAVVLSSSAGRLGAAVGLESVDLAAHEIARRIQTTAPLPTAVSESESPWYQSWTLWIMAGAVLASTGAGLGTYYALQRSTTPDSRVTFVLGRPR